MHEVSFDLRLFTAEAVKKAVYVFIDRFAADLVVEGDTLRCKICFTPSIPEQAHEELLAAFKHEALDQELRESIRRETAAVRNAILALALRPSGLVK